MAAKRDEVTIREVYALLDQMRRENEDRESKREKEARETLAAFEKRVSELYIEIYGEGETRGLKSRIGVNEFDVAGIQSARKTDAWKQFIITMITGLTSWAAATFVHK